MKIILLDISWIMITSKAIHQIKFVRQLKSTDCRNADDTQSMLILTILEKIKETILKVYQGSVTVL